MQQKFNSELLVSYINKTSSLLRENQNYPSEKSYEKKSQQLFLQFLHQMDFTGDETRELVEAVIELVRSKEKNEQPFRKLFLSLGIIANEFVSISRPGQSSIYGYFAQKGTRRRNKIGPEIDEALLDIKLKESNLLPGVDFFSTVEHYCAFVESTLSPELQKQDQEQNVEDEDDSHELQKKDQQQNIEDKGDVGVDRFTNEGPLVQFIHGEPKPTDGKVPENEGEEKANIENPEGAVQMEDLTRGNSTNPPVPTKDPDPHPPKKVRKEKAQLFEPIQIPLEARKFCFFHEPPQLPSIVHTLPEANGFTKEDIEALKKTCNGSALFGVVTVGHPLYGLPLVCEKHSRKRFYQLYGPPKCVGTTYHNSRSIPKIQQVCIQGGGGRPLLEEGKTQCNKQIVKRFRAKQAEVKEKLLQSYEEVCQEKAQVTGELDSLAMERNALSDEMVKVRADLEECSKQKAELYQQCLMWFNETVVLRETVQAQNNQIAQQHAEIAAMRAELAQFRR